MSLPFGRLPGENTTRSRTCRRSRTRRAHRARPGTPGQRAPPVCVRARRVAASWSRPRHRVGDAADGAGEDGAGAGGGAVRRSPGANRRQASLVAATAARSARHLLEELTAGGLLHEAGTERHERPEQQPGRPPDLRRRHRPAPDGDDLVVVVEQRRHVAAEQALAQQASAGEHVAAGDAVHEDARLVVDRHHPERLLVRERVAPGHLGRLVLAEGDEVGGDLADAGLPALLVEAEEVVVDGDHRAGPQLGLVGDDLGVQHVHTKQVARVGHPGPDLVGRCLHPHHALTGPHRRLLVSSRLVCRLVDPSPARPGARHHDCRRGRTIRTGTVTGR